jgi:Ca2+-binding RTX toxin-like protein
LAEGGVLTGALTVEVRSDVDTVRLSEEVTDSGIFTLVSFDLVGGITLVGPASDWIGLEFQFSDGEAVRLDDVQRLALFEDPAALPVELSFDDPLFLTTRGDDAFSGGEEVDQYRMMERGGHDVIEDAGNGILLLWDLDPADVTVLADGSDYLLLTDDEEIRLVGQADPELGIDCIAFSSDGTIWLRSDIAAHAVPLPAHEETLLPLQSARAGSSFTYALPGGLFATDRVIGDPIYMATGLDGSPLPDWLTFDAEHLVLSGTPGNGDAGIVAVALALADESEILGLSPLIIQVAPLPEPIFTTGADTVDFNDLSAGQVAGLEVTEDVYSALEGNDEVTLPDSAAAALDAGFVPGAKFLAGSGNDTVTGSQYPDRVDGGTGNDRLLGGDRKDILLGGPGDDVILGQLGNDSLQGSLGKDRLEGSGGDDVLVGGPASGAGIDDDVLLGGTGADRLQGGAGRDKLTGGAGDDMFVFTTLLDSASVLSRSDVVLDFEQGSDQIDLSGMDAGPEPGDQAFHYVGSGRLHAAGDLRSYISVNQTIIAGDIDGDGVVDFRIRLDGVHILTEEDFVL